MPECGPGDTVLKKRAREWRRFRKHNFFTQDRLAEVLGISVRTVRAIEAGEYEPHAGTLGKFDTLRRKSARTDVEPSSQWK